MQLTTYNPLIARRPLRPVSRLLNDFFMPYDAAPDEAGMGVNFPAVDIYEKDEKLVFEAELPGFAKEDITVDVKGTILTLSGKRESNEEVKEEGRFRRERRFGKFERRFKLPFEVSGEQVDATYRDGLLILSVEKPEEQKPKQITIN